MNIVGDYDHRSHVGNAGDVWKHFILAEAANCLLATGSRLIYAESHVGRPEYLLYSGGEWERGIGRCWRHLSILQNFCYFRILASLNFQGLRRYPGSTRLVLEVARMRGSKLHAEVWDVDPDVAATWTDWNAGHDLNEVDFHQGNGFAGVMSLLDRSPPGLLLIDPPYINSEDARLAEDVLCTAAEKGWVVLWWYMKGAKTVPEIGHVQSFSLNFADAGLDCGQWEGAIMALAGASDLLVEHLHRQVMALLDVL